MTPEDPMTTQTTDDRAIATLAAGLDGRVVLPYDDAYDEMRRVFLGDVDPRPSAIIRAAGAADVARVIDFVRDTGLELAVRCGGHSNAGQSTTDGGLVPDLRDMTTIDFDQTPRTVGAGAGLAALALTERTAGNGLAVGFGDTGSVGIAGVT